MRMKRFLLITGCIILIISYSFIPVADGLSFSYIAFKSDEISMCFNLAVSNNRFSHWSPHTLTVGDCIDNFIFNWSVLLQYILCLLTILFELKKDIGFDFMNLHKQKAFFLMSLAIIILIGGHFTYLMSASVIDVLFLTNVETFSRIHIANFFPIFIGAVLLFAGAISYKHEK